MISPARLSMLAVSLIADIQDTIDMDGNDEQLHQLVLDSFDEIISLSQPVTPTFTLSSIPTNANSSVIPDSLVTRPRT